VRKVVGVREAKVKRCPRKKPGKKMRKTEQRGHSTPKAAPPKLPCNKPRTNGHEKKKKESSAKRRGTRSPATSGAGIFSKKGVGAACAELEKEG